MKITGYLPRAHSLRTLTGKSNGRRSGVDCSQEGLSTVEVIQDFFSLRLQYSKYFQNPFDILKSFVFHERLGC